ncbi:hypothetical protein B296_00043239 [Ensete ventricosum]|uniref:Sugar phosphate transporter domain-containing protein n=1 Tax=Ensete ventricosum TaxID=4639 RepID=A0A426ZFH2_ENSVE|nr:hypothetical protein B296_00043239 [Ensete ventricosum]
MLFFFFFFRAAVLLYLICVAVGFGGVRHLWKSRTHLVLPLPGGGGGGVLLTLETSQQQALSAAAATQGGVGSGIDFLSFQRVAGTTGSLPLSRARFVVFPLFPSPGTGTYHYLSPFNSIPPHVYRFLISTPATDSLVDMISSVKHSSAAIGVTDLVRRGSPSVRPQMASIPLISATKGPILSLATRKPLYLASPEGFGFGSRDGFMSAAEPRGFALRCGAYEADRSDSVEISRQETRSVASQKVKIGIYFATWWALNVVFNIYNKKVLNAFPYPWLTSTLSLATGSLMMLISWATRIAEAPKTDFEFWKALSPVRKLRSFLALLQQDG